MDNDPESSYYLLKEENAFSDSRLPADAFVLHFFRYTHNDFQWKFVADENGKFRLLFDYLDKITDLDRWRKLSPEERNNGQFRKTIHSGEIILPPGIGGKIPVWLSAFAAEPASRFIAAKTEFDIIDGSSYTLIQRDSGKTKILFHWEEARQKELNELKEFAAHFRVLEIMMMRLLP